MTRKPLKLYEEILLLALDDDAGTPKQAGFYTNAMGGAILAELVMKGALVVSEDKKKTVAPGAGGGTQADPILGEALRQVLDAKKPRKARDWVMKFAGLKDLKNRAARQLVARGILAEETDQVLVFFRRTVFPERDGGPERELRQRLTEAVLTDTAAVEPRTIVTLALVKAAGMQNNVFGKREAKAHKDRIEALIRGDAIGAATKEAVQALQAAVMVAAIMPAVFAATTSAT